jgi:hypothetical protein
MCDCSTLAKTNTNEPVELAIPLVLRKAIRKCRRTLKT